MKCARCGHDSKFKERNGKRCPSCHGVFAFEPHSGDRLTDMAFKSAIDAVSAQGRMRWGVEHLYYDISRRWNRGHLKAWISITVLVTVVALVISRHWLALIIVPGAIFFSYRRFAGPHLLAMDQFSSLWRAWTRAHGEPKGLIVRQPAPPPARARETDIGDYSFDRAVICDRARTVDLLIANNFHFEHNCAVLSIDGYPPGPFATVRQMLKRNPRLQVFALHDATPAGCRMAYQLAHDPQWFKEHAVVTDVGLRPVNAKPFPGLWMPASDGKVMAGNGLSAEEAQWLSAHAFELAVFRPETILKRLFAAMTRKDSDGGGDSGSSSSSGGESSVVNDADAFSGGGGESGGGGADDSFG